MVNLWHTVCALYREGPMMHSAHPVQQSVEPDVTSGPVLKY